MYKFGKKSKERLKGVDTKLINVLNELIKIMDVTIIEGVRSKERQAKLLKQGATKPHHNWRLEESKNFTVAPAYNKGAYQVIPKSEIKDIGK